MTSPSNTEAHEGLDAWTPGPWSAVFQDVPYAELSKAWTVDAELHSICTIDSPQADAEANARLIAAAPELVRSLENLTNAAAATKGFASPMFLKDARALLAKIGGAA